MKFFIILGAIGAAVSIVNGDDCCSQDTNDALTNIDIAASNSDNADDEAQIENLCDYPYDLNACARDYFGTNAKCTVKQESTSEPVYTKTHYAYVPKINVTIILSETYFSNLNGTVEEFYINKNTGNLVMSVRYKGIKLESKEGKFFINRPGKEPKFAKDFIMGTYPVILTAVIPAKREITATELKKYSVSAYLPEDTVDFYIGPKVTGSEDPVVSTMVQELLRNIPTVLQELFLTGAPDFFLASLQQNICDFGIPLKNSHNL